MTVLDTNIWVYFYDNRDPAKRVRAQRIVSETRIALPWQVGCEFIAACRKLGSQGFTPVRTWAAFDEVLLASDEVLLPTQATWDQARSLQPRFGLSFWDALLAAACIEAGVTTLLTEDFGSLTRIDTLEIRNPFLTS